MKTRSAGYGGAGSSTNLTQGGVLQPESIEIAKTDHIVCQDCGKDQQYLKYQSKCRHCDKSFQFDNLAKFFLKR
jgi:Zn finger protein HypA/HybF involved in hydrogenase expression